MPNPRSKFYITTSIAYTNALPHIGFALELVQADVLARYHRILGEDVFFLTGTDEHGRKVAEAAKDAQKSPEVFCDEISGKFKELAGALNVSNDDFIRTTDKKRHWPTVRKIWLKLKENKDIYKKKYKGLYCVGCEAFITKKDLVGGKCRIHQKEPQEIEEENYFFKLSKYSKQIEKIIKKDQTRIIPKQRKNEMLNFIGQNLEDVSFSRPSKDLKWGIRVPDDTSQTIYVWADALLNYISALDYPKGKNFKKYWPADIHCLGKDILRFHATIFLGMLLSLKLPLPKNILVHGFITVAGQKMSKSLGNVIDPFELVKKYGRDPVRYFLLREILSTEDGDFTYEKFEDRYNSDLASGIGNLVARTIKLAQLSGVKKATSEKQLIYEPYGKTLTAARKKYKELLEKFEFSIALTVIWILIRFCDRQIEKEKLWERSENKKEIIGNLLHIIQETAKLLEPFMPDTSKKILKQIETKKSEILFPRI